MAEESGKGVALVILGIVAIIAIVGLVLLFTGARKAAVGEFALPSVKEYGGAIRGVQDPYSRAFSGRAREYPSGLDEPFSAQWPGSAGTLVGGESYGGTADPRGEQYDYRKTYERALTEIPSKAACQFMSERSNRPSMTEPASVQEAESYGAMGRSCMRVSDMASEADRVSPDAFGRTREVLEYVQSIGVSHCCQAPTLGGTV
ncbi:hypothetical protein HY489_06520 [Candidatus Woesearchaeota archaeon]|nr:hypothetical protein [Candidatus Woesearchaeota archaeon]